MVSRGEEKDRRYRLPPSYPILIPVVLLIIAVMLRIVDIFFLPFAEAVGEAFLHKALGFLLVLAYVWAVDRPVQSIGLHGRSAGKALWIGGAGAVLILLIGYGLQFAISRGAGEQPALVAVAIDPQTGLAGGFFFALVLLAGNVVNSFMEEGLFRGVMLTHFRVRLSPWRANILQAVIFGLWHLAWPAQRLIAGEVDLGTAVGQAALIVAGATVSGLAYGYLYLKTDSLWAPWLMHAINNSVFNLLHIRTVDGLDANTTILYMIVAVGYLAMLLWTKLWSKRLGMPELEPWAAPEKA